MTNYIAVLGLGKLGLQRNNWNSEKESYERNWMNMINDEESDEWDQIVENKEDDLKSEESETDEIYQIWNTE